MTYTIGQLATMFNLSASTIRYYDKEGLFGNIERESGIRKFTQTDVETLRIIECLKMTGMQIRDIREYILLCARGSETYRQRRALFEERKRNVEDEIKKLQKTLATIKYKCWYYDRLIEDGNDQGVKKMLPNNLPADIQPLYDAFHND